MKNPRLVGVKQFWVESVRCIVFLFAATQFTGELKSSYEGEVGWFTKEEMKNINLVSHFFEHLAVFEGDYSEYIYESKDSIKIYLKKIYKKTLIYSAYFINIKNNFKKGVAKPLNSLYIIRAVFDCEVPWWRNW